MEPQFLPETLEGERVILKRWCLEHAKSFELLIEKNHSFFLEWMGWPEHINTFEDVEAMSNNNFKKWSEKKSFHYAIFNISSNDLMGTCSAHRIEWDCDRSTIGYWHGKEYNGKGYMTEAIKLLQEVLFEIGINRVQIECDPLNQKSSAIPKRLNYKLDGILRDYQIHQGEYRDTEVYSKLRHEWEAEHNE